MLLRAKMKKWTASGLVLGSLIVATALAVAQTESFPWDRVIGLNIEMLDDDSRARVAQLAEETPNYYGCRGTVAECIAQDPPDRTAQRLAGFLARRVLQGLPDDQIALSIAERRRSAVPRLTVEINVDEAPCVGSDTAVVTIVEFADFQCPFCRISSPVLETIASERSDQVRFCYKHFPIRSHPRGLATGISALAAHRQGHFWEMHDLLYVSPDLSDAGLEQIAQSIGLDLEQFRADYNSDEVLEEVMADKYEGLELGVDRTPSIFVNGKLYVGVASASELVDRIEEELDMLE